MKSINAIIGLLAISSLGCLLSLGSMVVFCFESVELNAEFYLYLKVFAACLVVVAFSALLLLLKFSKK